ncbi:MAG TPA: polyprenyl synthetase family protein [Vicinamibacteria bacterium]
MRVTATDHSVLEATLRRRREEVDLTLRALLRPGRASRVQAAIEDSLMAPGKRLRPILALMVAEVLRGNPESVLPAAGAIEMVHTASLILDDLPCMDDATTRRGRPTCHVAHGEATAVLAAFALQNRAFEILGEGWPGGPDASVRAGLTRDLALAIGLDGMIAGQATDLEMTDVLIDFQTLEFIHSRKTGALFTASAELGAAAARASASERAAVSAYAKNLGLAFQVVDDLIDATGASKDAGKDVGKDVRKATFVSFSGVEGASELAQELVGASIDALRGFGTKAEPLRDLARYVVTRRS